MKKTILLTFLMLFISLIVETINYSSAHGENISQVDLFQAEIKKIKKDKEDSEFANSIKNIFASNNVIEKVEEKILYNNIKGTVHHAVVSQCDDTPLITADLSRIDTNKVNELRWVALSRDLLSRKYTDKKGVKHVWKGKIKLGDTIWIDYDKANLWKISHENLKPNDSISTKKCFLKYEQLKLKYEQIKGYWIVHDVMGTQYTKRDRNGKLMLDKNGNKQVIQIQHAIDFLQDPRTGMMDVWDRSIIIKQRKVKQITSQSIMLASN